jgi:hypothetical protein
MESDLKRAQVLANLLDSKYNVFGIKLGLDPLISLIPGLGDTVSAFLSFYLVYIGIKHQLPQNAIAAMIINIGLDYVIGLIPVVGDVSDVFFKANLRNFRILQEYADIITIPNT